jgi:uncharacterized OsmC-like protein
MEVKVTTFDHMRFAVKTRSHTLICDRPAENGGEDSGMTPPELMLASLGTCAAFYAAQYLKARNLATSGVADSVIADKLTQPTRLGNFRVHVTCPVALTDEQNKALMRSVHQCLIRNTLVSQPEILIELNYMNGRAGRVKL